MKMLLVILISVLALMSCSFVPTYNPINPAADITLSVVDTPMSPLITAHLWQQKNSFVISGKVQQRNSTSLDGYVLLRIIGRDGQDLWHKRAETSASGQRFKRCRIFEERRPSLPPPGSQVVVEFQGIDEAINADIFKASALVQLML